METPSPHAHLARLVILLVIGAAAFVAVRAAMIPSTWNAERSFREGALSELASRPVKYAGNQSCVDCHEDEDGIHETAFEELEDGSHKGISCESCHGPLVDHVRDGEKFADAQIDYSRLACLTCHEHLISTPPLFPMFIAKDEVLPPQREAELLQAKIDAGGTKIYRHPSSAHSHVDCTDCHYSFHNPESE